MLFVDVREEPEPEGITDTQGFSFHLEDALPFPNAARLTQ